MSISTGQNSVDSSKRYIAGQGVVDSSGNCEIDIPNPPSGSFYTGSVCVYDSPPNTQWVVAINGLNTDVAQGVASSAGIQIGSGDTLTIKAANLQLQTGTTYHATFSCIISPENNTNLIIPGHDPIIPFPAGNNTQVATGALTTAGGAGQSPNGAIFSTAGYESLMVVSAFPIGGSCNLSATFFNNAAGTSPTWTTPGAWTTTNGISLFYEIPVMGPYCQISISPGFGVGTVARNYTVYGIGAEPIRAWMVPTQTFDTQGATLAASSGTDWPPSYFYSGKYRLWVDSNQLLTVGVQRWNGGTRFVGGSWDDIMRAPIGSPVANQGYGSFEFTAPIDEWRVDLQNTSAAAATYSLAFTGPYT